jgi:hypothetical protein
VQLYHCVATAPTGRITVTFFTVVTLGTVNAAVYVYDPQAFAIVVVVPAS